MVGVNRKQLLGLRDSLPATLNKVNRRLSPDSALHRYIAQLHIIGR